MKKILEELSKNEQSIQHIASKRQVILVSDRSPSEIEDIIETLCKIRPSRIFLVREKLSPLTTSLRSLCHLMGGDQICSEVITLEGALKVVANAIKAITLPGVPLDVLLHVKQMSEEVHACIFPLSDRVSFDSDYTPLSEEILNKRGRVLDVSWLRLSTWRQETKALFDMILAHGGILPITKIIITGNKNSSLYFLYLGWLQSRLSYKIEIEFIEDTSPLSSVSFECTTGSGIITKTKTFHSRVTVNNQVEERVTLVGDERFQALYSRYILVGESLVNYKASAKVALQLKASIT